MAEKILFVDDEPAVLDGYKRLLHREFDVETAVGGAQGMAAIHERGPFPVVISDMRMPGMTGVQFLAQVRQESPDSVRMILTGYSDITAAMDAVNEGNVFRFLTKPCDKEVLGRAITTGLVQYRLVIAERELLENTLMGSIKVLTDVLSAVSPEAFGRSMRITRCVRHLIAKFNLPAAWRFEAAAMLSQLGCIALEPELVQAAYLGTPLILEDQARFDAHPQTACELLANIPRLEPVAWMISQQTGSDDVAHPSESQMPEVIVRGAKILKLAVAFDNLRMKRLSDADAIAQIRFRTSEFGKELIDALAEIKPESAKMVPRNVSVLKLSTGMILQQEVRTHVGVLVVGQGQEVTHALMVRLQNFLRSGMIDQEVLVLVPA